MFVRRSPAIVLSLALGAAALFGAPGALASDGGAAKDVSTANASDVEQDRDRCDAGTPTRAKLRVGTLADNDLRLLVVGTVWSDDTDPWEWKLKHNGEVSDDGRARGSEDSSVSFRVSRTMFNGYGTDDVVFRAENLRTGEICKAVVNY